MAGSLVLLVGLPGVGKTTFLKASTLRGVRLSLDDYRKLIMGRDYYEPFEPVVGMWVDTTARYLLAQGNEIIIDATNVTRKGRAKWLRMAKEYGAFAKIVWLDLSPEQVLQRNLKREKVVPPEAMQRMIATFEKPEETEGFDELLHLVWSEEKGWVHYWPPIEEGGGND